MTGKLKKAADSAVSCSTFFSEECEEVFEDAVEEAVEEAVSCSKLSEDICDLSDLEEIGETELNRTQSVRSVQSWIRTHGSIHNCREDPSFLLRFIRMQKHQIPKSCTVLENYLMMRKKHPQWFKNLDVRDEKLTELIRNGYLFALPGRDPDGRRVVFVRAKSMDPKRHTNSDIMRAHIITFEALLEEEETQVKGFTYIYDCSGVSLAHLSIFSPSEVQKIFSICQKNLPMRHKDINIVSLPFHLRAVLEFCKALLSDKLRSRFCVLGSFDKLYAKLGEESAVSLLPQEYGGSVPLDSMTAQWAEHLEKIRPILLSLDEMDIIERKMTKSKEESGLIWRYLPSFAQSSSGSV